MKQLALTRKALVRFVKRYQVDDGKKFRLKDYSPSDTAGLKTDFKGQAEQLLQHGIQLLSEYQDKLYAQDSWGLLLIFQAMDAAGKDGTIKHVMSGVNPQGVQVFSFKSPSAEELNHDYMWRALRYIPERGRIGIFNRSYYEEVLAVCVHPEFLERQHIPKSLVTKHIWEERYKDINAIERYLTRNGIGIRKFFLHVSKQEQKRRFLKRLEEPEKNWKFSDADVRERQLWKEYQEAYDDMIRNTATEHAPWYVVPADNKWFTWVVVVGAIIEALHSLGLEYPEVSQEKRKALKQAHALLESE